MKNKFAKILSVSLLSLGVFSGAVLSATKGLTSNDAIVSAYTNGDGATYYNDIGEKTGTQLLSALQSLNNTKLKSRVGYSSMPSKYTTTDARKRLFIYKAAHHPSQGFVATVQRYEKVSKVQNKKAFFCFYFRARALLACYQRDARTQVSSTKSEIGKKSESPNFWRKK